jgi:hypothetical protein
MTACVYSQAESRATPVPRLEVAGFAGLHARKTELAKILGKTSLDSIAHSRQ